MLHKNIRNAISFLNVISTLGHFGFTGALKGIGEAQFRFRREANFLLILYVIKAEMADLPIDIHSSKLTGRRATSLFLTILRLAH